MKSFSMKALALSFVVVVGSANAGFVDTVKEYATSAKNGVVNAVNTTDKTLFGAFERFNVPTDDANAGQFKGGFRPFSTLRPYLNNGYARAAVITAAATAVVAGLYKGYKHFRPDAEATVEADANAEVVA